MSAQAKAAEADVQEWHEGLREYPDLSLAPSLRRRQFRQRNRDIRGRVLARCGGLQIVNLAENQVGWLASTSSVVRVILCIGHCCWGLIKHRWRVEAWCLLAVACRSSTLLRPCQIYCVSSVNLKMQHLRACFSSLLAIDEAQRTSSPTSCACSVLRPVGPGTC